MVLSSVLNRSSRALLLRSSSCSSRSVATVASSSSRASPAICGGRFSRQPLLGRKHTDGLVFGSDIQQQRPVVLQVVYLQQRNFWGWKGGANDKGGKGSEEAGATGVGKKGPQGGASGAAEEPAGGAGTGGSSPTVLGAGDHAPRPSRLIGLSITTRPLFPTAVDPYTFTNPEVLAALDHASKLGTRPYVALFLRKEKKREWSEGGSAAPDGGLGTPEDEAGGGDGAVQLVYPEVISSLDEIHHVGTLAQVIDNRPSVMPGEMQVLLRGHRRLHIKELVSLGPPFEVEVEHWSKGEFDPDSDVIRAYCQEILSTVKEVINLNPMLIGRLTFFSERTIDVNNPFKLADFAASISAGNPEKLQAVLAEESAEGRLRLALDIVSKEREMLRLQKDIKQQVEEKMNNQKRTYFLQEQLRSIKKELGLERDDKDTMINKFRDRLTKIKEITEEAERAIEEELEKLSSLEKNSPEFNGTKSYLDWLTQLPWGHASVDNFDLKKAKTGLDEDHYGLDDIKERILEFIAVGKLRGGVHGKILCFVGPPGVGKTSIGHSIAKALDREFYRFSVGGLRDVAEIKGHRRTYVGSMPGKLIQCLKVTGTNNPVVLIDEIDKLGRGHDGDPASALLEVLDPSQNSAFLDNYLDVPVDLSNCLFICTANVLDTIPGPLKDRMEVIRLSGYDLPEKVAISQQYLIPKARREHGMDKEDSLGHVEIEKDAIESLIRWYAREAGVRNLAKLVDKIHRKLALEMVREDQEAESAAAAASADSTTNVAAAEPEASAEPPTANPPPSEEVASTTASTGKEGDGDVGEAAGASGDGGAKADDGADADVRRPERTPTTYTVAVDNLDKYVGKPTFTSDRLYERDTPPGVVMGLAWTAMGGSSLYIESMAIRPPASDAGGEGGAGEDIGGGNAVPSGGGGGGRLKTTGQLGDVMSESAQIAYSVARGCLRTVRPDCAQFFDRVGEVHMHVPEGATPKDGPSAGVTMVTSLLSLATDTPVRQDLAMTGELSLTGKVLPVGGIKEKTIAARRSSISCLVFPQGNKRDFDELPDYLKDGLEVHFAKEYRDIYDVAFNYQRDPEDKDRRGSEGEGGSPLPASQ